MILEQPESNQLFNNNNNFLYFG